MSQRVLSSSLKPALQVAAAKQVAAGGKHVRSAQVTFAGKQAYAVWDQNRWDKADRAFLVNYPALADDAMLSRVEADLIAAYTLHETGHVLYTNNHDSCINDLCSRRHVTREIAHPISNGLEDGRMENAVINQGVARNAKHLFGRLLNKLTAGIPGNWNPCDFVHAAFTCAMLSREMYGNGNSTTANLLARIPEPKRSLYAWVMDQCRLAPKGFDDELWAYGTAVEFVLRWRALEQDKPIRQEPPQQPSKEPPPSGPDDEEPDEEHGDTFEDEEFEDNDEVVEPGKPGKPDKADEADEADEGSGNPSSPWGDEYPEEEETGGAQGIGDEQGDGNGDEGEESDGAGKGGQFDFNDHESTGYEKPNDAEPGIDDIFKRANKRAEGKTKGALPTMEPAPFEDCIAVFKNYGQLNDRPYIGWE